MIAVMRLVLASSALLITSIDPAEPDRYVVVTYAALALYTLYSLVLYALAVHQRTLLPGALTPWVDVGWYVVLIGLSSGTNSIFFFFFFFAILVASFQWGFVVGLCVTLVSAALFTVVGFLVLPTVTATELDRFLLRPTYLLVLGYMIAYWGGSEIESKRRLALLKDVSTFSNPRFGIDCTLGSFLERLREFYRADTCLLITADATANRYYLRRADRSTPHLAQKPQSIPPEVAQIFLAFPAAQSFVSPHAFPHWDWWRRTLTTATAMPQDVMARVAQVSGVLAAESFMTTPFRIRGEMTGRLYLTSAQRHAFKTSEISFLLQVLDHTTPVLDNIRLVDRLASEAAEAERQRIALDLHDSIIQPYIGLQMGLGAIAQKLAAGWTDVTQDIKRLIQLTEVGVTDLRHYAGGLRDRSAHEDGLLLAVRRFAEKFSAAAGIAVHVEAEGDLPINDRLAAEVFQMVAEGLSNIRRHTNSPWARVGFGCNRDRLLLQIDNAAEEAAIPFTPRSLTDRAEALGGHVGVAYGENGSTRVIVDIPL